jgi:hypothetical protein
MNETTWTVVVAGEELVLEKGQAIACTATDGELVTGTLLDVRVEASGREVLTVWTGDLHRMCAVEALRTKSAPKARTSSPRAAAAPVDVHDYVRGERQRCAACGAARNVKAHTHMHKGGDK